MKYNILNILFFIFATALFVGCQEDYEDTEVESPSYDDDSAVRFVDDNSTDVLLNNSIKSFSLTVIRDNEDGALEVPITVVTNENSIFDIPGSVSFAAGEDSVSLTISIADTARYDVEYALELEFGDEYYQNPYKSEFNTYSGEATVFDVCSLDTGMSDFEGTWSGYDHFIEAYGYSYDSQVVAYDATDDGVTISGLNAEWITSYWGETITDGGTCVLTIDKDFGIIEIEEQYLFTTDYNGVAYVYNVYGSGTWDNCGDNLSIYIEYDLYNETDGYELPSYYYSEYVDHFILEVVVSASSITSFNEKSSKVEIKLPDFKR